MRPILVTLPAALLSAACSLPVESSSTVSIAFPLRDGAAACVAAPPPAGDEAPAAPDAEPAEPECVVPLHWEGTLVDFASARAAADQKIIEQGEDPEHFQLVLHEVTLSLAVAGLRDSTGSRLDLPGTASYELVLDVGTAEGLIAVDGGASLSAAPGSVVVGDPSLLVAEANGACGSAAELVGRADGLLRTSQSALSLLLGSDDPVLHVELTVSTVGAVNAVD